MVVQLQLQWVSYVTYSKFYNNKTTTYGGAITIQEMLIYILIGQLET